MSLVKVLPLTDTMPSMENIDFVEYKAYYEALVSDDHKYIDKLLSQVDKSKKSKLLNSEFDFKNIECPVLLSEVENSDKQCLLPLHIAITSNSIRVAKFLHSQGADIMGVDSYGYNLFHSCIATSFYYPNLEEKIQNTLDELFSQVPQAQQESLRLQENRAGMRPLEFAVQQGTIGLMKFVLLKNKGKTLLRTEDVGNTRFQWWDVEEYENSDRHKFSPVVMFAYMEKSKAVEFMSAFISCPFFGAWIKAKFRLNLIPIIIWGLLRCTFITTYMILDRNTYIFRRYQESKEEMGMNVTKPCYTDTFNFSKETTNALTFFLFLYAILSLAADVIECIWFLATGRIQLYRNLKGWKELLVSFRYYRACTFLTSLTILIWSCLMFRMNDVSNITNETLIAVSVCRLLISMTGFWSMMFFIQLFPMIGSSVLAIKGMVTNLACFTMLMALMLFPFLQTLQMYATFYSLQGCISDFDGLIKSAYSLFLMMLNMVSLTDFNFKYPGFIYIFHVMYVFMVGILLLNFLVAIMSESASRVAETEFISEHLNALAIAAEMQERLGHWLLKPYYKAMRPRIFWVDAMGRISIVMKTNRLLEASNAEKDETKN